MFKAVGAAALLVAGALVPGTATAAVSATCSVGVGSVTPGGDHWGQAVISIRPPTVILSQVTARGVYVPGQVKVSSSMAERDDGFDGVNVSGYVIIGVALYSSGYHAVDGTIDSGGLRRIDGGWGDFVALEEAEYQGPTESGISRVYTYGLRSDGVLFRWNTFGGVWRNKASARGFAAVKSMALISKSKTYDTFLANTRGGALYTIHIPISAPMKPIVKQVRASTWQGFETLLAQKCGQYGTLLLGIDQDTNTGYLYAFGHATATTTVIQSLGKVPAAFGDDLYFRGKEPGAPLTGE